MFQTIVETRDLAPTLHTHMQTATPQMMSRQCRLQSVLLSNPIVQHPQTCSQSHLKGRPLDMISAHLDLASTELPPSKARRSYVMRHQLGHECQGCPAKALLCALNVSSCVQSFDRLRKTTFLMINPTNPRSLAAQTDLTRRGQPLQLLLTAARLLLGPQATRHWMEFRMGRSRHRLPRLPERRSRLHLRHP